MTDIVEQMRTLEIDHEPDGWPAVKMRQISALCDEIDALRNRMVELLEILRNWEPDHASAEERRTILHAMYQTGILAPPHGDTAQHTDEDAERRGELMARLFAPVSSTAGLGGF